MSTLGLVSGSLEREQEQLRNLSSAMLALEAELLGCANELGFSPAEVKTSRNIICEFAIYVRQALSNEKESANLQALIAKIETGTKRLDDWQEDLDNLVLQLKGQDTPSIEVLSVMNDILSLLDNEFTQDLRRLYGR
ncbi:hypothetical protein [uncultured Nostoc sp.]|uniref:hypothetical protein n=1 Tax=uncultured Nostoc sp. TaxID=340711 RepID=UPI0035CB8CFC